MINPTFCDTVTLYHRQGSTNQWSRACISNCYFGAETGEQSSGVNLKSKNIYLVRIPETDIEIAPGDIIIKGNVSDTVEDVPNKRPSDILAKYKPEGFTVSGVKYNTKISFASHIRVTGE